MNVGQIAFHAALMDPCRAVPDGLIDPEGRAAGKRFDVYRNNVVGSLSGALAEAFPAIRKILGGENFGRLAGAFVRRYPPETPMIAFYGAALPDFLETFPPVRRLGYLPDVARLELAMRHSYHAADSTPMDARALQALASERLLGARFSIAPSVRIVASDWPVASIWSFNLEDGPKPDMRGETALVTRPGFDPQVTRLSPAGGVFVSALAGAETFGTALEAATNIEPDFDLAQALGALIAGNALVALYEEGPT